MAAEMLKKSNDKTGFQQEITPEEGVKAFQRLFVYDLAQVAVSSKNLKDLLYYAKQFNNEPLNNELNEESNIQTENVTGNIDNLLYIDIEKVLLDAFSVISGNNNLNIEEILFEAGFTSLNMIQVNSKIKSKIGKNIPLMAFFEYPNIKSLAKYIFEEFFNISDDNEEINEKVIANNNGLSMLKKLNAT